MKTKFTNAEWHWTLAHESLFDLTPEERVIWRTLVSLL